MDNGTDQTHFLQPEEFEEIQEANWIETIVLASPTATNLAGDIPLVSLGTSNLKARLQLQSLSIQISRSNVEMIYSTHQQLQKARQAVEKTKNIINKHKNGSP